MKNGLERLFRDDPTERHDLEVVNMESSEKYQTGNRQAFITGAVLGAGIALLLAPEAGIQIRRRLRDYATRSTKELDKAVDRGVDSLNNTIDRAHDFLDKGQASLERTRRRAKDVAEAVDSTANMEARTN